MATGVSTLAAMGVRSGELVGRSVYDLYRDHPRILDNQSKQCVFCHVPWRPNNLVNVPSPGYSAVRVKPFDPAASVLYGKVTGTAYGARMPLSGQPLSGPEQTLIRTWILEGAHNN